jgi:esterase
MALVQANGVKLHVQELGETGSPVVMIHGLVLATLSTWFFGPAPALATTHRVILYDLRNHGLSERVSSGFTLRSMVADLENVIQQRCNEPMSLVGHSYGGAIALRYAIEHPSAVKRLVLVEAPVPSVSEEHSILLWAKEMREAAASRTGEEVVQSLTDEERDQVFGPLPPAIRNALLRSGKRPNRLLAQILDMVADTTVLDDVMAEPAVTAEEIARVSCPVLLCYGEDSPMLPRPGHVLLTSLRDVRLEVLSGGHGLPFEAAAELARAISEFLTD